MPHYLPSSRDTNDPPSTPDASTEAGNGEVLADLKIFWGPEICRLEYLVHLCDTGRIKDEYRPESA